MSKLFIFFQKVIVIFKINFKDTNTVQELKFKI